MKVLIDNDHRAETPGKRSPDGHLKGGRNYWKQNFLPVECTL